MPERRGHGSVRSALLVFGVAAVAGCQLVAGIDDLKLVADAGASDASTRGTDSAPLRSPPPM